MDKKNCTQCSYALKAQLADPNGQPIVGQYQFTCHRFPPSAIAIVSGQGQMTLASAFPVVNDAMFCSLLEAPDGEETAAMLGNVPGYLTGPNGGN